MRELEPVDYLNRIIRITLFEVERLMSELEDLRAEKDQDLSLIRDKVCKLQNKNKALMKENARAKHSLFVLTKRLNLKEQ